MGTRLKTFDSTGTSPNGRLFAGDLNAIQDQYADQANLAQNLSVGTLVVGESGLQLVRFGAGEARITGALRTDGIIRALGGLFPGAFTTTQRNAIASPPYGLAVLNSTTNQWEWNAGTPTVPNWQPIAPPAGTVGTSGIADGAVTSLKIADGTIVAVDISGTLKPSGSAIDTDEALRALGTTAGKALPGTHFAATPDVAVNVPGPVASSTFTITAPVAGTYILSWGAAFFGGAGQGASGQITNNKTGGTVQYANVGDGGGSATVPGVVCTAGEVITFTISVSGSMSGVWARLTRTA